MVQYSIRVKTCHQSEKDGKILNTAKTCHQSEKDGKILNRAKTCQQSEKDGAILKQNKPVTSQKKMVQYPNGANTCQQAGKRW